MYRPALFLLFAALTAAATAQPTDGTSADEVVRTGLQALEKVDTGRAGELWDMAPAFVKKAKTRETFVDEMRQGRASVGDVVRRDWAGVVRIRYDDTSTVPPPGLYANVDYSTRLRDGRTVFEKLSFRLEPTGWQLTGYTPRQNQ